MKKLLVTFLVLTTCCLSTVSASSFAYTNFHALAGNPMVGGGLRLQGLSTSLDISASTLPGSFDTFHVKSQLLFYLMRNIYLGAGLGVLKDPESLKGITGSFEGSLGLEWQTRRGRHFFAEFGVIAPFQTPKDNTRVWPGLSLGYGF